MYRDLYSKRAITLQLMINTFFLEAVDFVEIFVRICLFNIDGRSLRSRLQLCTRNKKTLCAFYR